MEKPKQRDKKSLKLYSRTRQDIEIVFAEVSPIWIHIEAMKAKIETGNSWICRKYGLYSRTRQDIEIVFAEVSWILKQ